MGYSKVLDEFLNDIPDSLQRYERVKALRDRAICSMDLALRTVILRELETEIKAAEDPVDFRKALLNVVIAIKEGTIL